MDSSLIFQIANSIALLAWLPLWVAPNWSGTRWWVEQKAVVGLMGLAYLSLFLWLMLMPKEETVALDFSSLEGLMTLFQTEEAVLVGWIHYLAFDFLAGCYIFEKAKARHIPHLLLLPALVFTFMLGPVGWIFYVVVKQFYPIPSS